MSTRILDMLSGIGDDEQLKQASEKIKQAHEPEMGGVQHQPATRSEVDSQMGSTSMDQRAVLHEKALEAAGRELETRTWQDPREQLTAQANQPAGAQNVAPADAGRNMRETKTHLPEKTAGVRAAIETAKKTYKGFGSHYKTKDMGTVKKVLKTVGRTAKKHPGVAAGAGGAVAAAGAGGAMAVSGGRKKSASLADYWELCNLEEGEKIASEHLSQADIAALDAEAQAGIFMGRSIALGQFKQASGR